MEVEKGFDGTQKNAIFANNPMDFSKNIPKYLVEKGNTIHLVVFMALFSLVFINLFQPYGSRDWLRGGISDTRYFLLSSLLVFMGTVIVCISRLILYRHCVSLRRPVALWAYLLWIAAEIAAISFSFTLLEMFMFDDQRPLPELMKISLANTACILLLPYSIMWLYFSWRDKDRRLRIINEYRMTHGAGIANDDDLQMVNFHDPKGELKLAININDLFYIKGADNYLTVHYRDGRRMGTSMVRGTFKAIEDSMRAKGIIRCHRSYMVNRLHVRIFEKSKDGFMVKLDTTDPISIPVSKNYSQDVFELFGKQ